MSRHHTCLAFILLVAAVVAKDAEEVVWRTFGDDAGCGKGHAPGSAADLLENASSLLDCQALCVQRMPDLGCKSVEYTDATGSCRLCPDYVRYTHIAEGVQCSSVIGIDPVEVFIMMPLDAVSNDGSLADPLALGELFDNMTESGIDGIMTDVWWGLTEKRPQEYNFTGYRTLFEMVRARNWKVQAVASFHQCGGNVGDACDIPLPSFVREVEGLWYTDADGHEDKEYISLFADHVKVGGRTPIEMYRDWLQAFDREFAEDVGTLITEVMVGMGPAGELRYPSYQLARWSFCGVGEFQAYDAHAQDSLNQTAHDAGHPEWGTPPSLNSTGNYNGYPNETDFFSEGYATEYGKFFLDWYSGALKAHGRSVLAQARAAFGGRTRVTGKLAGIHWWYDTEAHAAEATAGYYNANGRNAYAEFSEVFAAEGAAMDFTCLEMRKIEQPQDCRSDPEELVRQVARAARGAGVPFSGENALERYDKRAYAKMLTYRPHIHSFSFLRLGAQFVQPSVLRKFADFVAALHGVGIIESGAEPGAGRQLTAETIHV